MKVYERYQDIPESTPPSVVTIGVFDGLHVGHQALLRRVIEEAGQQRLWPVALTFHPHPACALTPRASLPLLMPDVYKIQGMGSVGLRFVLRQAFDASFAALSSSEFSRAVLADRLNARLVVIGDDFAFGRNREGSIHSLITFGQRDGYQVRPIPRVQVGGSTVSSTRIRTLLAAGEIGRANELLGRPWVLSGRVVSGRARGRQLGFPTANLSADGMMIPGPGIYVGHAWIEGDPRGWPCVTNVGTSPTFGPGEVTVEPHLLDFHADILGKRLALSFLTRLRDEIRYPSAEALVAQIQKDVETARAFLAALPEAPRQSPLDGDRPNEPFYPKR